MDAVFFGTPEFALPALEEVSRSHNLKAVVSQPDKPSGRGRKSSSSKVKQWALAQGVPVLEPSTLKDNDEFFRALVELDVEVCVVAAYGKIIPNRILDIPREGFINIHGSILPRYRGAAPIQRALMAGDARAGVTIIKLVEGMDEGDMLIKREIDVEPDDDYGSLSAKLAVVGARTLAEALDRISKGTAVWTPQSDNEATYAPPIRKVETRLDWSRPAVELHNLVRGLAPAPVARASLNGKLLKVWKTAVAHEAAGTASPGRIEVRGERLLVETGEGLLELLKVQPEGKREMGAAEFLRGVRLDQNAILT